MSRKSEVFLFIALIFGVGLRLWNVYDDPVLWMDEIFSAQMAESPLRDLLLAVPRFDTHPPLYYLQLHFWAMLHQGDGWLILNSVLIDTLVILSLFHVAGRIYGKTVGLWVAAVYAVMPMSLVFAENLRMYAQFFLLIVWLWYLLEQRITRGQAGAKARIGAMLLGLGATLTHGLGFFVVFFIYLQAVIRSWHLGRGRAGMRPAALIVTDYIPVALAAAYSLGIGMFRQTEGVASLDLDTIGVHLAISLFGMEFPAPVLGGYLGFVVLMIPPLFGARSRVLHLWLVLLPIATLLLLSLTVKSVFMYRSLGLLTPFAAISLGLFYADAWRAGVVWKRLLSITVMALLIAAALNSSVNFRKEGYSQISAIWDREAAADAVLFTDGALNLWGISRYLPQVPRYSALAVQPPVRDGMLWLKGKLQGGYFDQAGLFGKSDHLMAGDRKIWPYADESNLALVTDYWVLDPVAGACLRPQDRLLARFAATGKTLLHCGKS